MLYWVTAYRREEKRSKKAIKNRFASATVTHIRWAHSLVGSSVNAVSQFRFEACHFLLSVEVLTAAHQLAPVAHTPAESSSILTHQFSIKKTKRHRHHRRALTWADHTYCRSSYSPKITAMKDVSRQQQQRNDGKGKNCCTKFSNQRDSDEELTRRWLIIAH